MSNKKLVLLTPSLSFGGLQRSITVLANYYAEYKNIEVYLIMYGISKKQFYPLNKRVHVYMPDFDFNNNKRIYYTFKTMHYLRRSVKALKPDSILSYGEYWNSFVIISLLGLGRPIYISDRCQPDKSLGRLHDWLRKVLYPLASGIVSQTTTAKEIYAKMIRHKNIEVIGNPIPEVIQTENVGKENIVLTVGRLIPTKHHSLLIDIFLSCYQPGWKLLIVGGDVAYGNVYSQLKEKIDAANASDKIELTGNISNVKEYYLKSKIFAFTSSSEGFPNVIGEAMAASIPVIAFDCVAGPSDMIEDGKNGFLIPLFEEKQFEEKLRYLMENEKKRELMGLHARESIRKLSVENIGEQYYKFIMDEK